MESTSSQWKYIDPSGQHQGPFTLKQMKAWYEEGWFKDDVLMSRYEKNDFHPISGILSKQTSVLNPPVTTTQQNSINKLFHSPLKMKSNSRGPMNGANGVSSIDVEKERKDSGDGLLASLNSLSINDGTTSSSRHTNPELISSITQTTTSSHDVMHVVQPSNLDIKCDHWSRPISKKSLIKSAESAKAKWEDFKSNQAQEIKSTRSSSKINHEEFVVKGQNLNSDAKPVKFSLSVKPPSRRKTSKATNIKVSSTPITQPPPATLDMPRLTSARTKFTRWVVVDTCSLIDGNQDSFERLIRKTFLTTSLIMVLSSQVVRELDGLKDSTQERASGEGLTDTAKHARGAIRFIKSLQSNYPHLIKGVTEQEIVPAVNFVTNGDRTNMIADCRVLATAIHCKQVPAVGVPKQEVFLATDDKNLQVLATMHEIQTGTVSELSSLLLERDSAWTRAYGIQAINQAAALNI